MPVPAAPCAFLTQKLARVVNMSHHQSINGQVRVNSQEQSRCKKSRAAPISLAGRPKEDFQAEERCTGQGMDSWGERLFNQCWASRNLRGVSGSLVTGPNWISTGSQHKEEHCCVSSASQQGRRSSWQAGAAEQGTRSRLRSGATRPGRQPQGLARQRKRRASSDTHEAAVSQGADGVAWLALHARRAVDALGGPGWAGIAEGAAGGGVGGRGRCRHTPGTCVWQAAHLSQAGSPVRDRGFAQRASTVLPVVPIQAGPAAAASAGQAHAILVLPAPSQGRAPRSVVHTWQALQRRQTSPMRPSSLLPGRHTSPQRSPLPEHIGSACTS